MSETQVREMLVKMLREPNAHMMFEEVIKGLPARLYGARLPGFSHTPWQVMEHMRIAQWDILGFSRDPDHVSPDWPEGYWPKEAAPRSTAEWRRSAESFAADLADMVELIGDRSHDLLKPFPHGSGQNLLREALLVMKHNSYHLGQLMMLRKMLERPDDDG